MKVSEADKLVCPFMSSINTTGDVDNGFTTNYEQHENHQLCITKKCMAWVNTFDEIVSDKTYGVIPDGVKHIGKDDNGFLIYRSLKSEAGYCKRLQ